MSDFIRQHQGITADLTESGWVIMGDVESRIKRKIERIGTPLKNWDIQINYGIKTGFNEAFIINEEKRIELSEKCPESASIIRPILRGKDIHKYFITNRDLWLINTHNGIKNKNINRIDVEKEYPVVYDHLSKFKKLLENRLDKGDHWTNLRNCAYLEAFNDPKIIYPEITKFINFFLDDSNGYLVNNKCFILTGNHIEYLTAFFNSSLFKFCFINNFPELMGGTRELRKIFFEQIPVKPIDTELNILFREKVKLIQTLKNKTVNTTTLEKELDQMIFDVYDLNNEERKTIGFIEIN